MHTDLFTQISLIIAVGAGMALIMRLIRQPLIIGHILTGIIVGPYILHIAQDTETIEVFAKIGIALLLFIIGLGLNPKIVKEVGKAAGLGGVFQVVFTTAVGWVVGRLLNFSNMESLFLGLGLAFSSTIIILKLLTDKKEQSRLYGKITIGLLLIQDVAATIALVLVTANNDGNGISIQQFGFLAVKGLALGVPIYLIGSKLLPKMHKLIAGSQEFLFLFAIGWGFGVAALFEWAGFSVEVGALFAGVCLASLPYTQEISARLRPLRDFFVVVFFIFLGMGLSFTDLRPLLPAIAACTLVVIVAKPAIVLIMMGMLGYTKKTSFKAAVAMSQVSEFSLVLIILGVSQKLIGPQLSGIMTFVALITIAISTYLIMYSEKLYTYIEPRLSMFERRKQIPERESHHRYDTVLFGYKKGGEEFLRLFQSMHERYVVVDYDPEVSDVLEHNKINYIYGDVTDLELLEELSLEHAKLVVASMSDHPTAKFIASHMQKVNPGAVMILHADSAEQAEELYELGASYVLMPHYLGSEKITNFIKRNGFSKSEFKKFREKQMQYIQDHYASLEKDAVENAAEAKAAAKA